MIQKLVIVSILTIVPLSIAYGQESFLDFEDDFNFEDSFDFEDMDDLGSFDEMEFNSQAKVPETSEPAVETTTGSSQKTEQNPALGNTTSSSSASSEGIYSTSETELILYRGGKIVKRIPKGTELENVQTGTGELSDSDEEPQFANTDNTNITLNDYGFDINTTEVDTQSGEVIVGSGTILPEPDDALHSSASGTMSFLKSKTLLYSIVAIALFIGGSIAFMIFRQKKSMYGTATEMPNMMNDPANAKHEQLEEKLAALRKED